MIDALLLGQAYANVSEKLQSNTKRITQMLQNGQVSTPEFQQLWRERDEAYSDWSNILHMLQELPDDGKSIVVNRISRMQTV